MRRPTAVRIGLLLLALLALTQCARAGRAPARAPAATPASAAAADTPQATPAPQAASTAAPEQPRTRLRQTPDPEFTLTSGGRERSYRLHIPPQYTGDKAMPLVVLMHGGGLYPVRSPLTYGMNPIADREGFIVAYPLGSVGPGGHYTWDAWNCCGYAVSQQIDDVAFIRAMVQQLQQRYTIDADRIYAAGNSNGAFMSYRLGCDAADVFAAIAPVSGALNTDSCQPSEPVSVIAFHGTADQNVRYDGGIGSAQTLYTHDDKPVAYAMSTWARIDGCAPTPQSSTSASGTIVTDTYGSCADGQAVVLYTIKGGGHAWPGAQQPAGMGDPPTQEISAAELIWAFFAQHPRQRAAH